VEPHALSEVVASYLLAQRARNRTEQTIRFLRQRLVRLTQLVHDAPPAAIQAETVRAALLGVKCTRRDRLARPISSRYVHQHHAVWRGFFNWCVREGILEASPMLRVAAPTVDEDEIAIFTAADVRALIATQDHRTFEGARNRAVMALLYDTGMRVGELVQLDRADVDLAAAVIHVRKGKSRRARRAPLSPKMRLLLRRYLDHWHRPALFPELDPPRLFTDRRGRALATNAVRQWMRRAGRAAGISTVRVSPHTWRHTFATEYLRNGGTESGLQIILGIRHRSVLDRYVHLVQTEFAARQHRKASPLARLGRV